MRSGGVLPEWPGSILRTEDIRADPDDGRAFANRGLHVVAHAHRRCVDIEAGGAQ